MSDKDKVETPTMNEVVESLKELRELTEKKNKDGLDEEKITKINESLDAYDEKNQELVLEQEKAKADADELKERIVTLEKEASRPGNGVESKESAKELAKIEHKDAFENFYISGHEEKDFTDTEMKYLRSDVDNDGGFLAGTDIVNEIIKAITEISPIRALAKIRNTSKGKIQLSTRATLLVAVGEGEGEEGVDDHSTYGRENLPIDKMTVTVPITIEELMDADFDMEGEINSDVGLAFGKLEGQWFVTGTGVKEPEGFMTNTDISERNSGVADKITMDSLILLAGDLKTGYNAVYGMNRTTIATVRTLKDGGGQYLWIAGNVVAGLPNQINGHSYIEIPDLADIAANSNPVVFGDFKRGYLIGDRMQMNVIRDPFRLKKAGKVEFTYTRRVGGQVILPEAIKKLKIAV